MVYRYEGKQINNPRLIEQLSSKDLKVGETYSVFPNKNLIVIIHMKVTSITPEVTELKSQGNWRKWDEEWSI